MNLPHGYSLIMQARACAKVPRVGVIFNQDYIRWEII